MGKAGRFACILTPMICTLISLALAVIIMLGGTNKGNSMITDLYFLRLDTRYVKADASIDWVPGTDLDEKFLKDHMPKTSADLGLHDFYQAHLWGECHGEITEKDGKSVWTVKECTKPSALYHFDMIKLFTSGEVKDAIREEDLPETVLKVNKTLKVLSNVMTASYVLGAIASAVTFFVGWFGLLSRWGSCVTTIFAGVGFLFLLVGNSIMTAIYAAINEGFKRGLKDFGVVAHLNKRTVIIAWVGVAFSFASALFWMFSTCCCSGRSSRIMGTTHNSTSEKAPYSYEAVATPYQSKSNHSVSAAPVQTAGYEPYRHAV